MNNFLQHDHSISIGETAASSLIKRTIAYIETIGCNCTLHIQSNKQKITFSSCFELSQSKYTKLEWCKRNNLFCCSSGVATKSIRQSNKRRNTEEQMGSIGNPRLPNKPFQTKKQMCEIHIFHRKEILLFYGHESPKMLSGWYLFYFPTCRLSWSLSSFVVVFFLILREQMVSAITSGRSGLR